MRTMACMPGIYIKAVKKPVFGGGGGETANTSLPVFHPGERRLNVTSLAPRKKPEGLCHLATLKSFDVFVLREKKNKNCADESPLI